MPSRLLTPRDVNTGGGVGTLSFEIAGFRSLDGPNCCEDDLTVFVNGAEVFKGSWNLGGGGAGGTDVAYYNPYGASWVSSGPGDGWSGGTVDVTGLTGNFLHNGVNSIQFVYSGWNQGLADEAWGLNSAALIAASPVPELQVLQLLAAGLILLGANAKKVFK